MPIDCAEPQGTREFLDLHFSTLPFEKALEDVGARARNDKFTYIVTPNVDHVVKLHAKGDANIKAFREAYGEAAHRYCDSRILARLASVFGIGLPVVPGSDLTAQLLGGNLARGEKVAIVGGGDDMLVRLRALFPDIDFLQHQPPMGMLANPAAMQAAEKFVVDCKASYVLFATGAPQSEIVAHRCARRGEARGVGLCIGASIDFLLGDQRRAPLWMQRAGFEWLHRLLTNPARLWRRYLVEGPRIFLIAARWRRGRGAV